MVSPLLEFFHQSPGAPCGVLCGARFFSFSSGSSGGDVLRQLHHLGVPPEAGWHSILDSERRGSVDPSPLRIQQRSTSSPVHSGTSECSGGFPQSPLSGPGLRVDLVSGGFPRTSSPVACHHRPLHDVAQSPAAGVFSPMIDP